MQNDKTDGILWNIKSYKTNNVNHTMWDSEKNKATISPSNSWAISERMQHKRSLLRLIAHFLGNPICILAAPVNTSARKLKQPPRQEHDGQWH